MTKLRGLTLLVAFAFGAISLVVAGIAKLLGSKASVGDIVEASMEALTGGVFVGFIACLVGLYFKCSGDALGYIGIGVALSVYAVVLGLLLWDASAKGIEKGTIGYIDLRDRTIYHMYSQMSLTAGEIVALNRDDADLSANCLQISGKDGIRVRSLALSELDKTVLMTWIEARGDAAGPLFSVDMGLKPPEQRLEKNGVHNIVHRFTER